MNRLVYYSPNADLRMGWDGLSRIFKLNSLKPGEFAAFVNTARTKVKLCTAGDCVAFLRLPQGRYVDPRVIQHLPEFFDGSVIDYNAAMTKVLRKQFPKWFEKGSDIRKEARLLVKEAATQTARGI